MILVDLNQVMISNLMAQIGSQKDVEVDENLLRHMILNALRGYKNKFSSDYGELVICCDSTNVWRKDVFPYYKAHRKSARDSSHLDWHSLFNSLNKVRDELKEFFPYKFVMVDTAEADDVIGVLCHMHGKMLGSSDPIMILSGDKDFMQLQKFTNVHQWDPVRKRKLATNEPQKFLIEHILKGDRGDGIPNVLSPGDVFVSGGRQKPLRQTVINKIMGEINDGTFDYDSIEFRRNEQLVDLYQTPTHISVEVAKQYEAEPASRSGLFNYFIKNRLTNLMEFIGEF
ncbi:hypothetical protein N9J19_00565 [bacterium]|nr:hypothetical protein [bacterium]